MEIIQSNVYFVDCGRKQVFIEFAKVLFLQLLNAFAFALFCACLLCNLTQQSYSISTAQFINFLLADFATYVFSRTTVEWKRTEEDARFVEDFQFECCSNEGN
jgi:hypothetical protein